MARKALGYRTARRQAVQVKARAAPIGGLNGRESLSTMPVTDAYQLDNWFPQQDGCVTRNGSAEFSTGMGDNVETLAVYAGGGDPQLIGFASGSLWNCTNGGPVGAAIHTGRSNDRVVATMFSNAGAQRLVGVNGADEPFMYDGAAYTALAITGVANGQETLAYVCPYNNRLYFAATGELGFYYLASEAVQGPADFFDFTQICKRGGYLVAIGTYSQDSGDGPNDYIVFVTSEGEVLVYVGVDPGDASSWNKVGVFYMGKPIGRKCLVQYGGDLLIFTEMGVQPGSVLTQEQRPTPTTSAITSKLGNLLHDHLVYKLQYGWQMVLHPGNNMLLLNVPFSTVFYQYVLNTVTGAWCRFKGWNGSCFAEMSGRLYFGGADGVVYEADVGSDDAGEDIFCDAKMAYDYFDEDQLKHWLNCQIMFQFTQGTPPLSAAFSTDYQEKIPQYVGNVPSFGPAWDVTPWDSSPWAADVQVQKKWLDVDQVGFAGSFWLRAQVNGTTLKWFASQYYYTVGGPL